MKLESFSWDAMGTIRCNKCGMVHELIFNGSDMDTFEDAIDEALREDGWDAEMCLCPDCRDQNYIRKEVDEDALEDEEYDEYADYDFETGEEDE